MVSGYTKKRERKYWLLFGAALLVLIPDILTKWLAQKFIPPQEAIAVIPGFFDLVNIRNRGAAFGFLNRSDIEWQFWLFLVATILAFIVIIYMIRQSSKQPLLALGLGMVLGGASGNLLDRIRYRAVVDFLDFYWQNWHWPAFNVADMGICLGAFLACISAWRKSPADK